MGRASSPEPVVPPGCSVPPRWLITCPCSLSSRPSQRLSAALGPALGVSLVLMLSSHSHCALRREGTRCSCPGRDGEAEEGQPEAPWPPAEGQTRLNPAGHTPLQKLPRSKLPQPGRGGSPAGTPPDSRGPVRRLGLLLGHMSWAPRAGRGGGDDEAEEEEEGGGGGSRGGGTALLPSVGGSGPHASLNWPSRPLVHTGVGPRRLLRQLAWEMPVPAPTLLCRLGADSVAETSAALRPSPRPVVTLPGRPCLPCFLWELQALQALPIFMDGMPAPTHV